MSTSPCKGCEERVVSPNCHTACIAYRKWASELQTERARKKEFAAQLHDIMVTEAAQYGRRKVMG